MTTTVALLETVDRGYLRESQLEELLALELTTLELNVRTHDGDLNTRTFAWAWIEDRESWVLVSTVTGTLYAPDTGLVISGGFSAPYIVGELPPLPWRDAIATPLRTVTTAQETTA